MRRCLIAGIVTFVTLTSQNAYADRAPRGYELLQSNPKYSFRYSRPGEPVRRGSTSERMEVRDGFCRGTDCAKDRLRSEIRVPHRQAKARVGKDVWFGWSFRVAQFSSDLRKVGVYPFLGQWKTAPENSPTVYFIMGGGKGAGDVYVSLGDMARRNNNVVAGAKWGHICRNVFSIEQAKRAWVDIVLNTNFSSGVDGYLKVWIDGRLACNYSGQIVATASNQDYRGPNHRRGIYIGNTSRWRAKRGKEPIPTVVVYYDEFFVGKTRGEVDTRMREAAGLPPKD